MSGFTLELVALNPLDGDLVLVGELRRLYSHRAFKVLEVAAQAVEAAVKAGIEADDLEAAERAALTAVAGAIDRAYLNPVARSYAYGVLRSQTQLRTTEL